VAAGAPCCPASLNGANATTAAISPRNANRTMRDWKTGAAKRTCAIECLRYFKGNPRQTGEEQREPPGWPNPRRCPQVLPGRFSFGVELGLGLAHFGSGRLAGSIERRSRSASMLDALLASLVDLAARLAQFGA